MIGPARLGAATGRSAPGAEQRRPVVGLLLCGGHVIAAAPSTGAAGRAASSQGATAAPAAGSNAAPNSGPAAPLVFPCGNVWTTQASYPTVVVGAAVVGLNGK